jgi:predicted DNA-binding helix-hairpin-helix protein
MALATRVSVNMELPTAAHLRRLAPSKVLSEHILAPMRQIARAEAAGRFNRSGQTTQLVVGAAEERDVEIGRAAAWLYERLGLRRVYYSKFSPLAGTPLAHHEPAPFWREHRLYQMDFLLRSYGFAIDEIPFDPEGQLRVRHR